MISFWLAGLIIRRRDEEMKTPNKNIIGRLNITLWFSMVIRSVTLQRQLNQTGDQVGVPRPLACHSFGYILMLVKPGMC